MRVAALVVALVFASRHACAQWRVGFELMDSYYGGSAVDTTGNPHARPGNALMATLRLERGGAHWVGAFRLAYATPGLSLTGKGLTITDRTHGQLLETSGLVGLRVGGVGSSGAVRAEVGPALHLWKVGDEIRARAGGLAATVYEWPVSARFIGSVRIEGTLSKSWFDAADLPSEYRRQVTWRYAWGLGLRYRL
jgi:hypothetical protein